MAATLTQAAERRGEGSCRKLYQRVRRDHRSAILRPEGTFVMTSSSASRVTSTSSLRSPCILQHHTDPAESAIRKLESRTKTPN
jgi:hypothetical protein